MERKSASSTVVVEVEEEALLRKSRLLTPEEEKVVRMRQGTKLRNLSAPLPRASGGDVGLEDELLLMEMQLLRAFRARGRTAPAPRMAASDAAPDVKDKIIRALCKKK